MGHRFESYSSRKMEEFICQYCEKICKNKNSLRQHEVRCKENPNHIIVKSNFRNYKGHTAWNKGLTKEIDFRVAKQGQTHSNNIKSGKTIPWQYTKSKEEFEKIQTKINTSLSKTVKNKILEGTWHNSFSKCRTHEYKGIKMMGTWEVKFAELLDKKNIEWEYTKDIFEYNYLEEKHQYNPDFYLPKFDLYIEIKGHPTKRDLAKWTTSNIKNLNIFFGDDLKLIGLNIEYRNNYKGLEKFKNKNENLMKLLLS